MTYSNNNERLDRIEAIVESNSRTIQGMLEQQATDRLKREEEKAEHEKNMAVMRDAIQSLVKIEEVQNAMLAKFDENHPTVLAKLTRIENKVDTLLDRDQ